MGRRSAVNEKFEKKKLPMKKELLAHARKLGLRVVGFDELAGSKDGRSDGLPAD